MKVIPTQYFLLIRMHDVPSDSTVQLPEGLKREPYGEVIAHGPQCTFCTTGDFVLFLPNEYMAGFDQGHDERFIIAESCVFAKCDPEMTQDGAIKTKTEKNPAEVN